MFVIVVYDVNKKKASKVLKTCRKYLIHIQNSVFEGEITEGKLNKLKEELRKLIDIETDSICIYRFKYPNNVHKEQIGQVIENMNIF